ncbi:FtsX-like permease family protein [Kitasatospora sp. NPDC092948]|uniref:FtsX-like permease family protein n=1 Tax=Kitasatospora sp. NPDC092948 TaxID=3364088 RepID=UPI00382DEDB5
MWVLALRTLKFRKGGFVAAFVAMFLGAAIVMACGGLLETGVRMAAPPHRLAGVPIVVTGPLTYGSEALSERRRIGPDVVEAVRAVPGVGDVIADLSVPAALTGPDGSVNSATEGHNWAAAALTPYALTAGAAPGGGQVVLDARLAAGARVGVGAEVRVVVRGVTRTFTVSGLARPDTAATVRPGLFFADAEAPQLAGSDGAFDSLGVRPSTPAEGLADAVREAVDGRATVLTGERRGLAELPGALAGGETVTVLAAVFGSWAVLIVMFGVASTLGLSLQQRAREMALLRAVGATSRQLRRMVVGETAVLAVLATVPAVGLGLVVGRLLFGQLARHGVVSEGIAFRQGWIPVSVGAFAAVAAAVGAALFAGRRAARTEPVAALAQSAVQTRWLTTARLLLALFFLVSGVTLAVVTATAMADGPTLASTAGPASVLFAIGLALLAPGLTRALVRAVGRPVRALSRLSGYLAVRNATTQHVRTAGAVAPIVLLVGIATGTLYMQSTEDAVSARSRADSVPADFALDSSTGGFAPGVLDAVRALPGVAGASELVGSSGFVDGADGSVELRGVSADGVRQTLAPAGLRGSIGELRGNAVALSERQAASFGVRIGDTLRMRFGDGVAAGPKVVATYVGSPQEEYLLLPADVLAPHTTVGLPTRILIRADAGADLAGLRSRLAGSAPGAVVVGHPASAGADGQIQQILVSSNYTVVAMIVGYAAITVVNSLVAVTRRRQGEFGLQRLTGATRAQVLGMLGVEGVLVSAVATVLGTVAAATTIVPYSLVKAHSVLPQGPVGLYPAIVGGALVLVLGATLVPSWRGMRTPPVETARSDG